MEATSYMLELQGVRKTFREAGHSVEVLRGVDLRLKAGEFAALTGPSGSGKTTLINLIGLLDRPTAGAVRLEGEDYAAAPEARLVAARKHRIGLVFQQGGLLPYRTALDNVAFRFRYLDVPRAEARARAAATLAALGLAGLAARRARLLSGGEKARVAMARAVVQPPALLLADEPTGNLDRRAAEDVMDLFRKLNREGMTILLATHNEQLLAYCTRRFALADGRILREDTL